jgi:DNA repair protein RadC
MSQPTLPGLTAPTPPQKPRTKPAPPPSPRSPTVRDVATDYNHFAGEGALSTTEIIAVILGTPQALLDARRLLSHYDDGLIGVARAPLRELVDFDGIGHATAARIKAALELGRRMLLARPPDRYVIRSPADLAQLMMAEMAPLEQEHFRTVLLDTRNRVLHTHTLYIGSLNASHVRISEVFRLAVTYSAAALIVCHNHPSGDPTPSPEDVEVTRQLVAAGQMMDVELLDHLIIGQQRFVSLRERGLGFA